MILRSTPITVSRVLRILISRVCITGNPPNSHVRAVDVRAGERVPFARRAWCRFKSFFVFPTIPIISSTFTRRGAARRHVTTIPNARPRFYERGCRGSQYLIGALSIIERGGIQRLARDGAAAPRYLPALRPGCGELPTLTANVSCTSINRKYNSTFTVAL